MDISVKTQFGVMLCFYKTQLKGRRTWTQMRRSKIQELLKTHSKINICLSTVSYHLCQLRKAGLIRVYERYKKGPYGTWCNLPSNRQITGRGIIYLKRTGIHVVKWLYNWAFKGIKTPRVIAKSTIPHEINAYTRPPRRAAGPPETLKNTLSDTLNSLK